MQTLFDPLFAKTIVFGKFKNLFVTSKLSGHHWMPLLRVASALFCLYLAKVIPKKRSALTEKHALDNRKTEMRINE